MGNSAYIVIQIENNGCACGGGRLNGRVLLSVKKEISADCLMFSFYGIETTKVRVNQDHFLKDTEIIVNSAEILGGFPGGSVGVGSYTFPFEVALPSGLPKTQSFSGGNDFFGISYHCEAKLHRPGMQVWSVKNSCEVLMNDEPYMSSPTPMYLGPATQRLRFMEADTSGTMTLGGKVNLTNVCANEKLRVNYVIRNDSKTHIKALEISLKCYVQYRAGNQSRKSSFEVITKRIEADKLVGASPRKKSHGAIDYNALLKRINDGEFGVDIPMDNVQLSTYSGNLIKMRYELVMTIKTTFGSSNSKVQIPIIMHRLSSDFVGVVPQVEMAHAVPVDWSAEEMPAFVMILSEPCIVSTECENTFLGLTVMLECCDQWQEISVLKDWLGHSPNNINLLTPDKMRPLFQCIKGDYSIYLFCQSIGEAMNHPDSTNKCTCKHIAEAAKAVSVDMKEAVCNTFAPYCVDRENARDAFKVIGLTQTATARAMAYYH
jgi:Arrestin (or S-antigen), C-terminal domain